MKEKLRNLTVLAMSVLNVNCMAYYTFSILYMLSTWQVILWNVYLFQLKYILSTLSTTKNYRIYTSLYENWSNISSSYLLVSIWYEDALYTSSDFQYNTYYQRCLHCQPRLPHYLIAMWNRKLNTNICAKYHLYKSSTELRCCNFLLQPSLYLYM